MRSAIPFRARQLRGTRRQLGVAGMGRLGFPRPVRLGCRLHAIHATVARYRRVARRSVRVRVAGDRRLARYRRLWRRGRLRRNDRHGGDAVRCLSRAAGSERFEITTSTFRNHSAQPRLALMAMPSIGNVSPTGLAKTARLYSKTLGGLERSRHRFTVAELTSLQSGVRSPEIGSPEISMPSGKGS